MMEYEENDNMCITIENETDIENIQLIPPSLNNENLSLNSLNMDCSSTSPIQTHSAHTSPNKKRKKLCLNTSHSAKHSRSRSLACSKQNNRDRLSLSKSPLSKTRDSSNYDLKMNGMEQRNINRYIKENKKLRKQRNRLRNEVDKLHKFEQRIYHKLDMMRLKYDQHQQLKSSDDLTTFIDQLVQNATNYKLTVNYIYVYLDFYDFQICTKYLYAI